MVRYPESIFGDAMIAFLHAESDALRDTHLTPSPRRIPVASARRQSGCKVSVSGARRNSSASSAVHATGPFVPPALTVVAPQ